VNLIFSDEVGWFLKALANVRLFESVMKGMRQTGPQII
jgi:hypothetical protein